MIRRYLCWFLAVILVAGSVMGQTMPRAQKGGRTKSYLSNWLGGNCGNDHSAFTTREGAPAALIAEGKKGPMALPLEHLDIRDFVARRSPDWFPAAPNKGSV